MGIEDVFESFLKCLENPNCKTLKPCKSLILAAENCISMVLVTGGTGLLGSHLIVNLLQRGIKVRATCRENSDKNAIVKTAKYYRIDLKPFFENLEWFEADLLDIIALAKAFDGIQEVYHCAAVVSFSPSDSKMVLKDNVTSTANMVNLAIDFEVRKFVHTSSVASLGRKAENQEINENNDWVESKNNSNYAKGKYASEIEVWRGTQEGLNAVIVNPSIIIGPSNWNSGSAAMFRTVAKGLKFYTAGTNAFVDVRDVAEIMIRLMESDISEERFIVAAENLKYKTFFEYIAKGLGIEAPKKAVGSTLSEIAWRIEWLKHKVFGLKPMITKETARTAQKTYLYSNQKVKKALGFEFRKIEDSAREIAKFYLADLES